MKLDKAYRDSYLFIHNLKEILGYKDIRSVIEWCDKNSVYILYQGNVKVVNTCEFVLSFYKPFINHLKAKHDNWKELFIDYLHGDFRKLIDNGSKRKSGLFKSKNETDFIQMLKGL